MELKIWSFTFFSVVLVSLISLIGVFFISLDENRLKKILLFMVSFAVGALFGDTFIHLLPEAYEKMGGGLNTPLLILVGILVFFVLEKFIRWRHCHIPTSDHHVHPMVTMNLIGDMVHNFIDGILIASSYSVSIPIGIATTFAVVLHEIPQEMGDFGVLVHGGLSVKKALLFNFLFALSAIVGAIGALVIGPKVEGFSLSMLPITAGGFVYLAGSDLIPELQKEVEWSKSIGQLFSIILGIGIMALLVLLE